MSTSSIVIEEYNEEMALVSVNQEDIEGCLAPISPIPSTFTSSDTNNGKSKASKKKNGKNRSVRSLEVKQNHNSCERLRRTQIREDLLALNDLLPKDEIRNVSTSVVLKRALLYIKELENREARLLEFKKDLRSEQQYYKRRWEQIKHLDKGGALGVGNTLVLPTFTSRRNNPQQSTSQRKLKVSVSTSSTSIPRIEEPTHPHILKKKHVLLTSYNENPNPNSQIIISNVSDENNVLETDDLRLTLDVMEDCEGIQYGALKEAATLILTDNSENKDTSEEEVPVIDITGDGEVAENESDGTQNLESIPSVASEVVILDSDILLL